MQGDQASESADSDSLSLWLLWYVLPERSRVCGGIDMLTTRGARVPSSLVSTVTLMPEPLSVELDRLMR